MVGRRAILAAALGHVLASAAGYAGCVSSSQPAGFLTGTDAVRLVFSGFSSTELSVARAGYGQWNRSTCNTDGTAFPWFQESSLGANRTVTVTKFSGLNPSNDKSCGNFASATNTIKLYSQVRNPDTGLIVPCDTAALLQDTVAHELGHVLGLQNSASSCTSYIMSPASFTMQNQYNDTRSVQLAECSTVAATNKTPTESSPPDPADGGGSEPAPGCDPASCSPILLLLQPGSPELTGVGDPVAFDIDADGIVEQIGWTDAGYTGGGFLVLDRDNNGIIDDGRELFGGVAEQDPSDDPNGFKALALFDRPELGGDADGRIGSADAVFERLSVWLDHNHDAISQADELTPLPMTGVVAIGLDVVLTRRVDPFGNALRWWSQVDFGAVRRPAAVDVIFVAVP